jgi:hypothetical protein
VGPRGPRGRRGPAGRKPKIDCSVPKLRKKVQCKVVVGGGEARATIALRLKRHGAVVARTHRVVNRRAAMTLRPADRLHRGSYVLLVKVGGKVALRLRIRV